MNPGDRVVTASGRSGLVVNPPWSMPFHHLIDFGGGELLWIVRSALSIAPPIPVGTGETRRRGGRKGKKSDSSCTTDRHKINAV